MEEWKDIKGYEGIYKYNPSIGKIMSVGGRRGGHKEDYVLGEYLDSSGYPMVILRVNGDSKTFKVHRLIAENELPNPNGYTDVDHKNGCKTDNRVENLHWCTHSENVNNPITKKKWMKTLRSEDYRKKMSEKYIPTDGSADVDRAFTVYFPNKKKGCDKCDRDVFIKKY